MRSSVSIKTTILILAVLSVLLIASIPPSRAGFVLASWDYPSEYGQGIEFFDVFENSSGSWQNVGGPVQWDESGIFEWGWAGSIKLAVWTWFNSSLMGASSINEGKLYHKHNVSVTQFNGSTVFSQQNFTYISGDNGIDPPLWLYRYEVILDFVLEAGEYYTVTVIYEVFW